MSDHAKFIVLYHCPECLTGDGVALFAEKPFERELALATCDSVAERAACRECGHVGLIRSIFQPYPHEVSDE
jgi:Zn ribbon nucleic-acid-binding protein